MNSFPATNTENVGVAPALICVTTVGPIADVHAPVWGFVSHKLSPTGRVAFPVSAETVMLPPAPTLADAKATGPVPTTVKMLRIPASATVAGIVLARAITSGVGLVERERRSVVPPRIVTAGLVLVPAKLNATSIGGIGAVGVMAMRKLWEPWAGMATGVFGDPVNVFVCGSVV